jgi:hypothetical protein
MIVAGSRRAMRAVKTFTVVFFSAAVVAASALAAQAAGLKGSDEPCPDLAKAVAQGGCILDPWPGAPSKFSQVVAKAAFTHNYDTVWKYLHPTLQKAVSESSWQACQKKYPLSSPGVKIGRIRVADSKPVPTVLPLLGKRKMRAITLQILFTAPGNGAQQVALEYAYWIQDKGNWKAVWLPDTYQLYKSGKCDTTQTRGLY